MKKSSRDRAFRELTLVLETFNFWYGIKVNCILPYNLTFVNTKTNVMISSDSAEAVGGDDDFAVLDGGGDGEVNPLGRGFRALCHVEQLENFLV